MRRRKFILGTSAFAAGAGGIAGSGAFTSVSAKRGVSVAVAGDDSALLAIDGCDGPNGNYVTGAGSGTAVLNISPSNDNLNDKIGSGVNPAAVTVIHNVLELTNQGTQPVGVWLDVDSLKQYNGTDRIQFYLGSDETTEIIGKENAKCLGVGDSICIGLKIDTRGLSSGDSLFQDAGNHEMVVNADVDADCAAPPIEGGEPRPLSTGVADWQVVSVPEQTDEDFEGFGDTPYDAYTIDDDDLPEAWIEPGVDTDAKWIDPLDTGGLQSDPTGDYTYELEIEVDEGPRYLVIEGYSSDNPVEFYLDPQENPGAIGGTSDSEAYEMFRSDISTQTLDEGTHRLRAVVTNEPNSSQNPTGLLVAARLE